MKKYTFGFYPNGELAQFTVVAETKKEAEASLRAMLPDCFFDDGLFLIENAE